MPTANMFEKSTGFTSKAWSLYQLLEEEGFEVTLIGRSRKENKRDNFIPIAPPNTRIRSLRLTPIILRNRFNCVFCIQDIPSFLSFHALKGIRGYKVIFFVTMIQPELSKLGKRGDVLTKVKKRIYRLPLEFAIKKADYVLVEAEYLYKYWQGYHRNIVLITHFVDEELFRRRVKKPCREKRLGIIGPFDLPQNRYYLEFLFKNLDRFHHGIEFVVIGRTLFRVEDPRITYTGYLSSLGEYIDWLSNLDAVLVVHKPLDPGPYTKILESMSCSLPVFTTPQGRLGMEEAKPGRDILVFEEDELAEKLNELIFDSALMRKIGRNARKVIESHYSKRANKERLVQVLYSLGITADK